MCKTNDAIIYYDTYKMYQTYKYVLTFPNHWILNEKANTGRECANCCNINPQGISTGMGMWRGVIIGYCINCANDYGFSRGYGFQGQAVENIPTKTHSLQKPIAALHTYLLHIDLNKIGNIQCNPKDTIENHIFLCELQEYNAYLDYINQDDGYDSV
jgi:hypothetical protein